MDILAVCKSVFCNVLAVRRANLKLNIDSRACAGRQDAGLTVALLPPTPRRVLRQEEVKLLELKHSVISLYSVSGLSCPGEEAYLTVIFHSFLHNNNINSDYILGGNIYFTPHGNFS